LKWCWAKNCGFNLGELQISQNMEWTIVEEEKSSTIWFFHLVVKLLQPFLEQNFNHPCFFIPLIQEIEFFFIELFVEHMQLLNMSNEKRI
jgi:hypothetical protein